MNQFKVFKKFICIFMFFLFLKQSKSELCNSICYYSSGGFCSSSSSSTSDIDYCTKHCKPLHYQNFKTCYYCSQIISSYYTINEYYNCYVNECIGDKIIYETKECTSRPIQLIVSTYRIGDFIYYNYPPDLTLYSCTSNICTCNEYHYTELIFGKKYIHCKRSPESPYNYYNHITKEIFTQCPQELNYKKVNELSTFTTRCSDSCELYEWNVAYIKSDNSIQHYCVNDCRDTVHHPPSNDYVLEYIDSNGIKNCVKECPIGTYKRVESAVKSLCVTQDKCDFYARDTYECYSNCGEHRTRNYHNFGSRECIEKCTKEDYLYADEEHQICYRKEDCKFIEETNLGKYCLNQCPNGENDNRFYNYYSKSCIHHCGSDGSNNKYYAYNKRVCYPSCIDIPDGDYKFESKDEVGVISKECRLTQPPGCNYYYKKVDGIFKCVTQDDCYYLNYYYYFGSECKANCDGYYQLVISQTQIKCYESLTAALSDSTVKYCDISQKKCWTNFPNNDVYYIKQKFNIGTHPPQYEIVRECPYFYYKNLGQSSDFPLNLYVCKENCKEGIYKFFVRDNKQCLDSCTAVHLYYYDEDNYECLESCELRPGKPFSYPVLNSVPTKCLSSCRDGYPPGKNYYNYDSHTCLLYCKDNNNNYLFHKDTTDENEKYKCYPSCLDIEVRDGNLFEYVSFGDDNICYTSRPTSNCQHYYTLSDGMKKCATLTECDKLNYLFLEGEECKAKCNEDYYKLDKTEIISIDNAERQVTFTRCYISPNDCLINEGSAEIFYNKDLKRCYTSFTQYQNDYFIKEIDYNKFEIVQTCDDFYYIKKGDFHTGYRYCTPNCMLVDNTDAPYFFEAGNKLCEDSCLKFGKKYYDPTNNECLDTCTRRTNMEYALQITNPNTPEPCLIKCPSDNPYFIEYYDNNHNKIHECIRTCPYNGYNYIDIKTNECLARCKTNLQNLDVTEKFCYPKCNVENNLIYINSDTYECVSACPTELTNTIKVYTLSQKNVYLCKSACDESVTPYRYGNECLEKCPQGHNHIGYNNICKDECYGDPNGEYYYPINGLGVLPPGEYVIYKCVSSCSDSEAQVTYNGEIVPYDFYVKSNPHECLYKCPDGNILYLQTNPKECLNQCPDDYPFFDKVNHNYECKSNTICTSSTQYFYNGVCYNGLNDCINENKKFVDSRNICLDKCPENDVRKKIEYFQEVYTCLRNC